MTGLVLNTQPPFLVDNRGLYSVFLIHYAGISGTGFAINVADRQYLVTAKHNVRGIKSGDPLEIETRDGAKWTKVRDVVMVNNCEVDIIALALSHIVASNPPPALGFQHLMLGQDAVMVGFPFRMRSEIDEPNSSPFPLPFLRRGIISAFMGLRDAGHPFFIDTNVNPGFSGAPVLYWNYTLKERGIAGVVHGPLAWDYPVLNDDESETGLATRSDTGWTKAFGLDLLLDAIQENPVGLPVA